MDADTRFLLNRIDKLDKKISRQMYLMERKLDPLIAMKNRIIGATLAINVVFTMILNMLFKSKG